MRPIPRVAVSTVLLAVAGGVLAGCGNAAAQQPAPSPSPVATDGGSPADQLAGLVAAAADRHYTAPYDWTPAGSSRRQVTVTLADDASWRLDVPGGGLGGGKDVSVAGTKAGVYQCGLGAGPSCVRVAGPGGHVPARFDPQVEKVFTDWIGRLGDRNAPLSVDTAPRPSGVTTGTCFSIEPTAASLSSPVPSGIYCLDSTGTVTGARLGIGRLALSGTPGRAPATVKLAGPVTGGQAVPTTSPSPSPSPSPSRSSSPSASPSRR
ncbi:hypothetical protein [Actinocatenispora rupis]|uniref:Lipoprotein n=1 Tax=Actinocatenispora rupis TaxID=519421 RepID=A0A8J3J8H6_9ACTN|nr:hypothetical protein [Actinocatenispora rupis]GID13900.1 hypothetical protein Aru02nite_47890 [Actinocatenispora rupis]